MKESFEEKELSTIDAYIKLLTTFPRGDAWARADQLWSYNEQLEETGKAKLSETYMAAFLFIKHVFEILSS